MQRMDITFTVKKISNKNTTGCNNIAAIYTFKASNQNKELKIIY